MQALRYLEADQPLLRWGGLTGLLGGVLMLFVFVWVGVVVGPDPIDLEGPVSRFPEIATARTVENALYLTVIALWAVHSVALFRALRGTRPGLALAGSVLGVAGLTILAAGALPHVATSRLAGLYHAAGATSPDRTTIALLWQANQGIFDALLAAGLVLLLSGVLALALAMVGAPAFGRRFGAATIAVGATGLAAATAFVLDPRSPLVAVAFFALIAFHLIVGWKVHRLSRAPGAVRVSRAVVAVTEAAVS